MKSKATILLIFVIFYFAGLHKLCGQVPHLRVGSLRIDSLHDVSLQLVAAGNSVEALALNAEVEKMVLEQFGPGTAVYGECRLIKGAIYYYNSEYEKSIQVHLDALDIFKKTVSKEHTSYTTTLFSLGNLYQSMGQYDKAEEYFVECKELFEKTLGKEHPYYASTLDKLWSIYESLGQYERAEAYLLECKELYENTIGKNHPDYASTLNNLGSLYLSMGKYEKAERYLLECKELCEKTIGKDHLFYASTLNNLGDTYIAMGKYESAERYFFECKSLFEKSIGKDHPYYASTLSGLGSLYQSMGKYERAMGYYLECKEIDERILGKEHPNYATTLNNLGSLCESMGQYQKAMGYFQECKQIREKILGKEHPDYASSLNNLGALYQTLGQFRKVEEYFIECKELFEKTIGKENPSYAITLNNLGNLYQSMGQYEKSLEYYLESKEIFKKTLGNEHPSYTSTLSGLGALFQSMGHYEKAEGYYLECRELAEKVLGKEHNFYATTLNNLGHLYKSSGQYEQSMGYFIGCKDILERTLGREHPEYASILINLGDLFQSMGQHEKAEKNFIECKELYEKAFGKENDFYASAINNLGAVYKAMGQYEKAEVYYFECKEIREKALGKEHPNYALTLENLAGLFFLTGQYEKAEVYFVECREIREKTIGKEHPNYATTLNNLGLLYHYLGQDNKAERYFLECKNIKEKTLGKQHPDYATSLNNLARLYEYTKQYNKAEPLIDTAMRATQQNLRLSVQFLSEKDLGDYLIDENRSLQFIPSYINTGKFSTRMAGLAYDDALFQKGFLQTAARRLSTLTAANPEADSLSQLLASYRKRLSTEYTKPIAKRGAEVAAMENRANELESQLARVVAGYSEALQQVKWQEVQAALKPNEAAIEFLQFRVLLPDETDTIRYAALLLRPGMEAPMYINLCDERAIDSLMIRNIDRQVAYVSRLYAGSDFNRSTTDTSLQTSRAIKISTTNLGLEPSEGAESFRSLYELLWQPLEKHLKGVEVVYYANAGLMHRINLGAITTGKDSVLADRYKLVELGSTRSLVVPEKTFEWNSNALVMGGIKYDSDSTALRTALFALDTISYTLRGGVRFYRNATDTTLAEYWLHLPFTSKEADGIGLLLQKSRIPSLVLKDYQATEEAFYKSVRLQGTSPRIIHLATHGYFLPDPKSTEKELAGSTFRLSENPLIRSGLILAGGNQAWMTGQSASLGQEDGILTAYEISRLNLTGTELVVLSACETGLGDIQGNEGVYGLQRAFKIAGARYVIMSLWQIPDEQSSLFMENFYQRWLEQGMSIPEAFRQTQTAMRQNKWSHHQWAGFVLLE